jgi:hypothetical protein
MAKQPWSLGAAAEADLERLASELGGSELHSLLLEVMHRRATARTPAEVAAQYGRDPFCAPCPVDQRTSVAVDAELLAAAQGFEAIELSPVAPLGTCSAVAPTHQNRVLSALRGTEVVSDPTNVLALECARRLRAQPGDACHFATSQRVLRAQPVPRLPGYSQHFRIFVLASGGTEAKDHAFTVETLALHVRTMSTALDRLEALGFVFGARRLDVLATEPRAALGDRLAESVRSARLPVKRRVLDHAYYSGGLRYMLWVHDQDGTPIPLIDGGAFDWLAQLASNRRAVLVASGMGAQLVPLRFRPKASSAS